MLYSICRVVLYLELRECQRAVLVGQNDHHFGHVARTLTCRIEFERTDFHVKLVVLSVLHVDRHVQHHRLHRRRGEAVRVERLRVCLFLEENALPICPYLQSAVFITSICI